MAISITQRLAGPFAGNGMTTVFPFVFKVFATTDLYVLELSAQGVQALLMLGTDYTAALNSNQDTDAGGTVTLTAPLATGSTLVITSDMAELQTTVLQNLGGFFPTQLNNVFDTLTILIQQLQQELNQCLRVTLFDDLLTTQLPPAAERANTYLAFDARGNVILVPLPSSALQPVLAALIVPDTAGGYVQLTVQGGGLQETALTPPQTPTPNLTLIDSATGQNYLITATHGAVGTAPVAATPTALPYIQMLDERTGLTRILTVRYGGLGVS